jgi:DNA-directed RNA polymerase subunit RPC12/RpoP
MMAAPAGTPGGADTIPAVQCPHCGSSQFFGEKRITGLGIFLIFAGFGGILLCIPFMFIFVGFLALPIPLIMFIVGVTRRRYVNVCARCRKTF